MTQPIQEPTLQRTDARLTWGQNQLFRRPAPGSGAQGENAYAAMWWPGGADIVDDSKTPISEGNTGVCWAEGYINDAGLALTPQPFSFDFCLGEIHFRSSGIYHAQFIANWADTFTPNPSVVGTILEYFGDCALTYPCGDWISTDFMYNNNDWQQYFVHATGHVIVDQNIAQDSSFRGAVIQKSDGNPKFLSAAALIVTRLGDFTGNDGGEYFISGT